MGVSDLYCISIYGPFEISRSGRSFKLSHDKEKALVAVLCLSPKLKRSRRWMAALLWGELSEDRAAANLRQAIWRIKSAFESSRPLISADRDSVWINEENISEILPAASKDQDLLEGLCVDEEAFEDWLRENRSRQTGKPLQFSTHSWLHSSEMLTLQHLPLVAVFPCEAISEIEYKCSNLACDLVIKTLLEQKCVDVYDLRHGIPEKFNSSMSSPSFGLYHRATVLNGSVSLVFTMKNLVSGQVLWTRWIDDLVWARPNFAEVFSRGKVTELANAVHDQVYYHSKSTQASGMFTAVQHVLSHRKSGQALAKPWLTEAAHESGVARAWLTYTFAVAHAERHGGLDQSSLEELKFHCLKAHEVEPENPIVRAIIGHINAFVFRDFEEAEAHHSIARKIGWNHPVVWTLSAMHANYTDRPELAYQFSTHALNQSTFSPNRFYFEGPYSISCSLTGRHKEAILVGNSILAKKPGFLAVMRHLVASQVHSGQLSEARANISEIREKDPQFAKKAITASDYPLPSSKSVDLINSAFEIAGL